MSTDIKTELLQETFLQFLTQFLLTAGIPARHQPIDAESSFEYLLIGVLQDGSETPDWARFYSLNQAMQEQGTPAIEAYTVLNLDLPLGIQVPEPYLSKTAFLLSMINRLLPGPVLLINPDEGLYFSYRFVVVEEDEFWPGLLLESLNLLRFLIEPVRGSIKALISEQKTIEEAMAYLEKALATPPADRGPLFSKDA